MSQALKTKQQGRTAMTVREAGEKGGRTTREKYGSEFYQEIGKGGGDETAKRHGPEFYHKIGKKGGQRVKQLIAEGRRREKSDRE
jgi:general stress protein YciG